MNFWGKSKSKKKKKKSANGGADEVTQTIIALKDHQLVLTKKIEHLNKKIATYNAQARQCMKAKNKKGALMKIRLRKQVEKRVETLENQNMNLELQMMTLDETAFNRKMMFAMQSTNEAMKVAMKGITVEKVDDIQADLQEMMELNEEISAVTSQPLMMNEFDDDELLAELDDILEEENENIMFGSATYNNNNRSNANMNMNTAHSQQPQRISAIEEFDQYKNIVVSETDELEVIEAKEEDEEDAELRQLEKEMNMLVMSAAPNDLRVTGIRVH